MEVKVECRNCGHQDEINVRKVSRVPLFPFVCTKCLGPWYREVREERAMTIEHSGQTCRVVEGTVSGMFRQLTDDEVAEFRSWANDQPMGTEIKPVYHPVSQDQLFITGKGVIGS
jgi:hypothetical protein